MKIGGHYNWKYQPERLVYIGHNWSGNGYWHQFEKVGEPGVVWCEVRNSELNMIEETPAAVGAQACPLCGASAATGRHGKGYCVAAGLVIPPVADVPAFDATKPCLLTTADPTRTYCERCKNPHHACDRGFHFGHPPMAIRKGGAA